MVYAPEAAASPPPPTAGTPSTGLQLTISLRYGVPALTAARAVRAAVHAAARRQLGLTLGHIDIEVADIHLT